ncbi:MAG: NAD(P)/FAD-dependent oxidoreductase [Gammaproteobacteria bacterium]|nr:NAD(P)/FAD-dependent oxidoreductase [Gammaproteobacteria bacterium]
MTDAIVVIGGGQAAFSFAEQIRRKDAESTLTVLCDEHELPYNRPPLSKQYVKAEIKKDKLLFRDRSWYERKNIDVRVSTPVAAVDISAQSIVLDSGDTLPYTKALMATGSVPKRLPASIGGELGNVLTLRNVIDADAFAKELSFGKRVLIIGGGYIGLEAAAVARHFDAQVCVLEMSERILQRVACRETSDFFRKLHTDNGVEIKEKLSLDRLEGRSRVQKAYFSDGSEMDVDLVLVGIGVEPNTQLAQKAGLAIDNGIVVNEHAQTSEPTIYAAGDCACFPWRGTRVRLESVQNAVDQAKVAALHASGTVVAYNPTPWFWSDQFDVTLQIAGLNTGYNAVVRRKGSREGGESFWYFKDDQLLALDAVNDPKTYVLGRKALERDIPLTQQHVADDSLDLKTLINEERN